MPGSLLSQILSENGIRITGRTPAGTDEDGGNYAAPAGPADGTERQGTAGDGPAETVSADLPPHPQNAITDFWKGFVAPRPSKAHYVLPDNFRAAKAVVAQSARASPGKTVSASYTEAREFCTEKVTKIARDYSRVNQKYIDPHFDMEFIQGRLANISTIVSLDDREVPELPKDVKRVGQIFRNPQFYLDGPEADDIHQGDTGDCWFLAATATVCSNRKLIEKVCIARDEKVGVYGFVFFRDGEWRSTIVDDRLFLTASNYEARGNRRIMLENGNQEVGTHRQMYKDLYQTGSQSLFYAHCTNENETWLPLLEKAFAKAHGDYGAISGGQTGEGVEDLTGGVTTQTSIANILDTDKFWNEEMKNVNERFLFACSCQQLGPSQPSGRDGIVEGHAYSVLKAVEAGGKRFVLIRNPWGQSEWKGKWSDGSKEWNAHWIQELGHKFGNDGKFWMEYEDLLDRFDAIDRTRLFDDDWAVTQAWTNMMVPWTADYLDTKFEFTLKHKGNVVVVLSQLDTRYFKGLEGQYTYTLSFRIQEARSRESIVRSLQNQDMERSCNVELNDLPPGTYSVLVKISARRYKDNYKVEDVIKRVAADDGNKAKLVKIGLSYDLAQVKGKIVRTKKTNEELDRKLDKLLELMKRQQVEDLKEKRVELKQQAKIAAKVEKMDKIKRRAEVVKAREMDAKRNAKRAAKKGQSQLASQETKIQRSTHVLGLLQKMLSNQMETRRPGSAGHAERADSRETIKEIELFIAGLYRRRNQIRAHPGAPPERGDVDSSDDANYPSPPSTAREDDSIETHKSAGEVVGEAADPGQHEADHGEGYERHHQHGADNLTVPQSNGGRRQRRSRGGRHPRQLHGKQQHHPHRLPYRPLQNGHRTEPDEDVPEDGEYVAVEDMGGEPPITEPSPDALDLELTDLSEGDTNSECDTESDIDVDEDIRDQAQQRADLLKNLIDPNAVDGSEHKMDPNEELHKDPWNAVCTCGLRVYAEKQTAEVRVVHPKSEMETGLDDDDAALDATWRSNQVRITLKEQITLLSEGIREQQLNMVDYVYEDQEELLHPSGTAAEIQMVRSKAGGEEALED